MSLTLRIAFEKQCLRVLSSYETESIIMLSCDSICITRHDKQKQKCAQHAVKPVSAHAHQVTCSMPHFWALERAYDAPKCYSCRELASRF